MEEGVIEEGVIESPNYPDSYPDNVNKVREIVNKIRRILHFFKIHQLQKLILDRHQNFNIGEEINEKKELKVGNPSFTDVLMFNA